MERNYLKLFSFLIQPCHGLAFHKALQVATPYNLEMLVVNTSQNHWYIAS